MAPDERILCLISIKVGSHVLQIYFRILVSGILFCGERKIYRLAHFLFDETMI